VVGRLSRMLWGLLLGLGGRVRRDEADEGVVLVVGRVDMGMGIIAEALLRQEVP
jgi:hypothetical protein